MSILGPKWVIFYKQTLRRKIMLEIKLNIDVDVNYTINIKTLQFACWKYIL